MARFAVIDTASRCLMSLSTYSASASVSFFPFGKPFYLTFRAFKIASWASKNDFNLVESVFTLCDRRFKKSVCFMYATEPTWYWQYVSDSVLLDAWSASSSAAALSTSPW